jgi:hypothetical protein
MTIYYISHHALRRYVGQFIYGCTHWGEAFCVALGRGLTRMSLGSGGMWALQTPEALETLGRVCLEMLGRMSSQHLPGFVPCFMKTFKTCVQPGLALSGLALEDMVAVLDIYSEDPEIARLCLARLEQTRNGMALALSTAGLMTRVAAILPCEVVAALFQVLRRSPGRIFPEAVAIAMRSTHAPWHERFAVIGYSNADMLAFLEGSTSVWCVSSEHARMVVQHLCARVRCPLARTAALFGIATTHMPSDVTVAYNYAKWLAERSRVHGYRARLSHCMPTTLRLLHGFQDRGDVVGYCLEFIGNLSADVKELVCHLPVALGAADVGAVLGAFAFVKRTGVVALDIVLALFTTSLLRRFDERSLAQFADMLEHLTRRHVEKRYVGDIVHVLSWLMATTPLCRPTCRQALRNMTRHRKMLRCFGLGVAVPAEACASTRRPVDVRPRFRGHRKHFQ